MSPTDKEEFLLPQSLSEALTMEMKLTERRKSGEFSPKLVGSPKNLGNKANPMFILSSNPHPGVKLPAVSSVVILWKPKLQKVWT